MDATPQTREAEAGSALPAVLRLEVRYPDRPAPPGDGLATALAAGDLSGTSALTVALTRPDWALADAAALIRAIETWPKLGSVQARWRPRAQGTGIGPILELARACQQRPLPFAADILLDSNADAHAHLSRRPTSLTPAIEAGRDLRAQGVTARWLIPAIPALVPRLEALFSLALAEGIEPMLLPPNPGPEGSQLSPDERLFLWDFVTYRLLGTERGKLPPGHEDHYRAILAHLNGAPGAQRAEEIAILEPDGDGRPTWRLRVQAGSEFADPVPRTGAEKSGDRRAGGLLAQVGEAGGVLLYGTSAHLLCSLAKLAGRSRAAAAEDRPLPKVMLIGAYGGEHIGDAAILGGVLFRMHRRHGTREAVLMSQRPEHTRHLVPMLDVPVRIEVEAYEPAKIRAQVKAADAVVFAGGPLIDLPKQLVRHLHAVSLARLAGKPFIAEGIGPGPFPRWSSQVTARRLVEMAERISIRTSEDSARPVIRGLKIDIGRDPAFDYLATRGDRLSRLPERERPEIERLLADTRDRPLIGINLRPIGHHYTAGVPARDREAYTRQVEARFEMRFAEGLQAFDRRAAKKPCYVFFPMNAIQFGMSDLRSAFRVKSHLDPDIDFRTWEADASLDGVVDLLRRLDIVITMRFHATIFALSQKRPVIGIDYRIGKRDKVAAVLSDAGQGEHCTRIDQLTSDWLCDELSALSAAAKVP